MAGGTCFILDFSTLVILTEFAHFHYLLSAGIAFFLASFSNYLLSIGWVFKKRRFKNYYIEYMVFISIGFLGLSLNQIVMWFFTEKIMLYYILSKIIAVAMVASYNYFLKKFVLFNIDN